MSVELVTGYYGVGEGGEPKRHVSSAEDGARQAGTVGLGSYVLSTGSKLSATMEDANTLVVADGDAIMNGRHVSLPDPTSFTIPTGVQGQKVSNIAVLRYSKAADSVESVTPVVLTGEPSADAPTDPDLSEGSILDGDSPVDMPLYRVVTDGINAGDPEPLFETIPTIDSLRDSVSQRLLWSGDATVGQTFEAPGIEGASLLKVALSNADPNTWWVVCSPTEAYSTSPYDATFVASIFSRQEGSFIFATCTAEIAGTTVRVRSGSVFSGASVAGMTDTAPLHVRRVYRLL